LVFLWLFFIAFIRIAGGDFFLFQTQHRHLRPDLHGKKTDKSEMMEENKKTDWLKLSSLTVPYIAVLIGLYLFKNAWIAIGLYHLGIALFVIYADKGIIRKVFAGWKPVPAFAGITASVIVFAIIYFLWEHVKLEGMSLGDKLAGLGLYGTSWIIFMVYFSTAQPLLEELFWRGYLERNHKFLSWAELAFAGYHILVLAIFIKPFWLIIAFIVLIAAAYLWRLVGCRFKGLAIPLLSHITADICIMAVTNILI